MRQTPSKLLADWLNRDRPLLIIDECRRPMGLPIGDLILYAVFETTTKKAVEHYTQARNLRETLHPTQLRKKVFKGRELFGQKQKVSHGRMKKLVNQEISNAINLAFLLTAQKLIQESTKTLHGGIHGVTDPIDGRPSRFVSGPELLPALNLVRQIAVDRKFGENQIDILIDRSVQLGLGAQQATLEENEFESFGPAQLNQTPDGSPPIMFCPTYFHIVSASEKNLFRDLLLLPDAIAYIELYCKDDVLLKTDKISEASPFYYWYPPKERYAI